VSLPRTPAARTVRLHLCDRTGEPLRTLPEFAVDTPWWPDVEPVVRTARDRFGVDVFVLRLLTAQTSSDVMGGAVSYLAEQLSAPPTVPAPVVADDHPLRAAWARPGGLAKIVAWADDALAAAGRPRVAPPVQVKTWNLSSILRLPTAAGDVWCKSVPQFMAHESAILTLVAGCRPNLVPPVLAARDGTVLLADVPGEDLWHAPTPTLIDMVDRLVDLQATLPVAEVLAAGVPDWRAHAFPAQVEAVLSRAATLDRDELAALDRLAADLPRRFAELADCGLPETLVHGDFHPGNWRTGPVLVDWGDSGVGHPLLDRSAFLPRIADPQSRAAAESAWLHAWRERIPGSDPVRAAEIIAPIAALRQAVIYQRFLDGIEPDEHRYHVEDVPRWLRRALE
jgi:phosphotransferase family enzyme